MLEIWMARLQNVSATTPLDSFLDVLTLLHLITS